MTEESKQTEEGKQQKASGRNYSGRWWEGYLVRYLLPSLAGMILVGIYISTYPNHIAVLFPNQINITQTSGLILIFIYGNILAYVAGYPALTLHATRIMDHKRNAEEKILNCIKYKHLSEPSFVFMLLLLLITRYALYYFNYNWMMYFYNALVVIFVVSWQLIRMYICYKEMNSKMHSYILRLDAVRRNDKYRGVKDTYHHLREHGNTAIMFLLEIILFISIMDLMGLSDGVVYLCIFIVAWILPSVLVHSVGQRLEEDFSNIQEGA